MSGNPNLPPVPGHAARTQPYEPTGQPCPRCGRGVLLQRTLRKYLGSPGRVARVCSDPACRWQDVRELR